MIERLAQLRREVSSDAETVDVISEVLILRADTVGRILRWSMGTSVRHALCYQVGAWYTVTSLRYCSVSSGEADAEACCLTKLFL